MQEFFYPDRKNGPPIRPVAEMEYFHVEGSTTLDVILHGSNKGMDSGLITKIFAKSKENGHSVAAFNFPYMTYGGGPSFYLAEEVAALREVLTRVNAENFPEVRLIGKSLGGMVVSEYLLGLSVEDQKKYNVVILGYDKGSVNLKGFPGGITVIQGSKDGFGNAEAIKKDLEGAIAREMKFVSIEGADHSYRKPRTKDYVFEDQAVEAVFAK